MTITGGVLDIHGRAEVRTVNSMTEEELVERFASLPLESKRLAVRAVATYAACQRALNREETR